MPQQFSCERCGKNYAWKAELAGKKVRWGCGPVMTALKSPPAELVTEELYDLAADSGSALSAHAGKSPSECLGPGEAVRSSRTGPTSWGSRHQNALDPAKAGPIRRDIESTDSHRFSQIKEKQSGICENHPKSVDKHFGCDSGCVPYVAFADEPTRCPAGSEPTHAA